MGARRGRQSGFTLIELLVVIAIIVGLAVLLWPLPRPREKGRLAECTHNQKLLVLGLLMYSQDHESRFPPTDRWAESIVSRVGSRHFVCPGDDSRRWRHGGGPYAMSLSLGELEAEKVPSPDKRPLLWDADPNGYFARRHGGLGAVAFVDGHAKAYRQLLSGMGQGVPGLPAPWGGGTRGRRGT